MRGAGRRADRRRLDSGKLAHLNYETSAAQTADDEPVSLAVAAWARRIGLGLTRRAGQMS